MDLSLHFAGMYVLCRIAGMKSKIAHIAAYSSQYIDDATNAHALKFKNDERVFKQTQTSYELLSPRNFNVNESLDTWMPFHFLPGGDKNNPKAMVTSPDSKVLELLLKDVTGLTTILAPYRLGIALHCFADSYTHQDFKGFYDKHNDVKLLYGANQPKFFNKVSRQSFRIVELWCSDCFSIGHAEVLDNPDIPYAEWAYARGNQVYKINNLEERYIPAFRAIYTYLTSYLAKNLEYKTLFRPKPFDHYLDKFRKLMAFQGTSTQRYDNWIKHIHENYFEFPDFNDTDQKLGYNPQTWFNQAVEAVKVSRIRYYHYKKYNYHAFRKKVGFENSHWVRFMQAAAEHQYKVVHELLPYLGIIVG